MLGDSSQLSSASHSRLNPRFLAAVFSSHFSLLVGSRGTYSFSLGAVSAGPASLEAVWSSLRNLIAFLRILVPLKRAALLEPQRYAEQGIGYSLDAGRGSYQICSFSFDSVHMDCREQTG